MPTRTDDEREPPKPEEGLPTSRDALIGLAIGLGLLYLGTRLSTWWLRWPLIGLGALFVLVMSAYIVVDRWQNLSAPGRRLVMRMRGHIRADPLLGTLHRNPEAEAWEGVFATAHGPVELLIGGKDEPAPGLVARAREVVAEFPALEHRLDDYLARTAAEDVELATEIRALRVSMLRFNWPERADEVEIVFDGPDDIRYWTCIYAGGELKDLNFD